MWHWREVADRGLAASRRGENDLGAVCGVSNIRHVDWTAPWRGSTGNTNGCFLGRWSVIRKPRHQRVLETRSLWLGLSVERVYLEQVVFRDRNGCSTRIYDAILWKLVQWDLQRLYYHNVTVCFFAGTWQNVCTLQTGRGSRNALLRSQLAWRGDPTTSTCPLYCCQEVDESHWWSPLSWKSRTQNRAW